MLPFLFAYPVGVAVASALGLAISDAVGLRAGHMSGLLPYGFALVAFILAAAACVLHAVLVGRPSTKPGTPH